MIEARDISFFEDLFSKTVAMAPSVTDLPHRSTGLDNGRRYHRPMKGFIEPIGYLMAFLKAYNSKDEHTGKIMLETLFPKTFKAKNKTAVEQIAAIKQDINAYAGTYTRRSFLSERVFSHTAERINSGFDGMTTTHTVIKNFIRSIDAEGFKKMLFFGRDAWWFAVIAERMGINYYYDSTISRGVSSTQTGVDTLTSNMGYLRYPHEAVFVDTGFEGSIVKNLKKHDAVFEQVAVRLFSANRPTNDKGGLIQPHPNFVLSRNYALSIEYYPKLNYTGKVERRLLKDPFFEADIWEVTQKKNNSMHEILMWYALTVWYYFAETPNFVKREAIEGGVGTVY